jgi:bifunctional DNA-binding transcriptional regulator/antitoxin component of YhaV-PrlF toxin-antitoxin module
MAEVKAGRNRTGWTRISAKNQATLPVEALAAAGLRAGDRVHVRADGAGRIVLTAEDDAVARWAGTFDDVYPEGYLEDLREEWDSSSPTRRR